MEYRYKSSLAEFDFEVLNAEIEAFSAADTFLSSKLFTIQLVIEELVTNILKYGVRTHADNLVDIKISCHESQITLCIADNTAAFNPLLVAQPDISLSAEERKIGGLGLFLVRKQVASLIYKYRGGMNIISAVIE